MQVFHTIEELAAFYELNVTDLTNPAPGLVRIGTTAAPKSKNGFVIGMPSGCVMAGNWELSNEPAIYAPQGKRKPTKAQLEEQKRLIQAARLQNQKELEEQHKAASQKATDIFYSLKFDPSKTHLYLERKGIPLTNTMRVTDSIELQKELGLTKVRSSVLLIPIVRGRTIWSLQIITPDGSKMMMKGGRMKGNYWPTGKLERAPVIVLGEGVATVLSAVENRFPGAVGAAAMNAGNLMPVAGYLSNAFPQAQIIVAADNDINPKKKENRGLLEGRRVVQKYQDMVISYPEFTPAMIEQWRAKTGGKGDDWPSDWNDFYLVNK